ncbi:sulfotransferase [Microcoleus sp. CAWBG58]|uniref:sulfotransferase n=1 Tax=Microcoleus sp. CAWBG58 TaxID=2841651 RepID=UPI0025CCADDF|nr:sulfotransferase [Microcoleus sp. CAWBG58]
MDFKIKHEEDLKKVPTIEAALKNFSVRWPNIKSNCDSSPVFIFSAGWRSGSTLLQRLVMSSGSIIVWGEPYGRAGLIDHLSSPLKSITDTYPAAEWFIDEVLSDSAPLSNLAGEWIANLYPDINYLLESHIAFLVNHFEKPAKARGILRWGLKEVRLTIDHAIYLKWLFPNAKFLFLYRNPYNAYASFQGFYWYKKWPNEPVYTPEQFGLHWKNLLQGYIADSHKVNGMLIKYEDLCNENFDFTELENYLELKLNKTTIEKVIYSTKRQALPEELRLLNSVVNPLARELGYELVE